jgi:hypothetical protein
MRGFPQRCSPQRKRSSGGTGPGNITPILWLTDWLTDFMELSHFWEAANCAVTQELPKALWNPKVHHCVHKSPSLVPIQSQIDPVHAIPTYLYKNYFNIVTCRVTIDGFGIGWLDLLTPHTYNSGLQEIQRYWWYTQFRIHRCTSTRILSLH